MRIIAGEFRSRTLQAPRGWETRPTSDRLRETFFNVLGNQVEGARFLDLYAGSGANGLEALSRGAREAVLVERAAPALAAIRGNIAALGLEARARVEPLEVQRWLGRAAQAAVEPFELVFLDPPYEEAAEYQRTLAALGGAARGLLGAGATVVAEYRRVRQKGGGAPTVPSAGALRYGGLEEVRVLEQGDAALRLFQFS